MTTATAAPAITSEIKAEIVEIAAGISKHITSNAKEGTIAVDEKAYGEAMIAAGSSLADKEKVQKADSLVLPAMALAIGKAGKEVLKKNTKLDLISADVKAGGHDEFSTVIQRDRVSRNPSNGQESLKHYAVSSTYTYKPAANGAQMKKVRDSISEMAAAAAAGK